MSKIDTAKVIDFLNNKWGGQTCPMCRKGNWSVSEDIFEMRKFNNGNLVIGGPEAKIIPLVPITCSNCGKVVFVNAIVAGLISNNA
jgi:hypothetical protein